MPAVSAIAAAPRAIIRVARGSTDHPANLQALCAVCNFEEGGEADQ